MDWSNLGIAADIIGVLGAFLGVWTWINTRRIRQDERREQERLNERVKLVLKVKGSDRLVQLPGEMRRAEVTRAEVLGWVGMLPMKEKGRRFEIAYMNSAAFLHQLNNVQTGNGDVTFVIDCEKGELDQFALEKPKPAKKGRA